MNRWLKQVRRDMRAEKKKVFMGGGLLCVALLLWGRLLLSDPPRSAVADPEAEVATARSSATPNRPTPPPPAPAEAKPEVVFEIDGARVGRDLFAFDAGFYPDAFADPTVQAGSPKSEPDSADQNQSWRASRRAVLAEASSLKLQSTMLGARSRAMIDGVLLETGQTIRGFELIEVRARQVTLVKQGVEVTLEM